MKVSVAVIGAGPAGAAAALTLRRYVPELKVALVAPRSRLEPVGEALSPGVLPLLAHLGLDAEFRGAQHRVAGGTASAWGAQDVQVRSSLFSGLGHGWHLDRARFDAWLADAAEAAGAVRIVGSVRSHDPERRGDSWHVTLDDGVRLEAAALVDATGRAARIARRFTAAPVRDDALVADVRWYDTSKTGASLAEALVEAAPNGWWYTARLAGDRGVAMFMTDGDLLRRGDWEAQLASAPATAERMEGWRQYAQTAVRPANSQMIAQVAGPGWVAAGDAAAAFDPISSLGIGFALSSGVEAARAAVGACEGETEPAITYQDSVRRIYADYRRRLAALYQAEGRWPDSIFWRRRQAAQFSAVESPKARNPTM